MSRVALKIENPETDGLKSEKDVLEDPLHQKWEECTLKHSAYLELTETISMLIAKTKLGALKWQRRQENQSTIVKSCAPPKTDVFICEVGDRSIQFICRTDQLNYTVAENSGPCFIKIARAEKEWTYNFFSFWTKAYNGIYFHDQISTFRETILESLSENDTESFITIRNLRKALSKEGKNVVNGE